MGCRENTDMCKLALDFPGKHINFRNPVDLIPEKFHPHSRIRTVGRKNLQSVPADTEGASVKIHLIAGVLNVDQFSDDLIPVLGHARTKRDHHVLEFLWRTQSVNTGYGGDDDNVLALRHGSSGREPELVDLVIDGRVLGNVGVRGWHICFRLVIIVIGDEILHRILREKLLKFPIKLRRQRLIVRQDQSRLIQLSNNIRHGKRLTRPRHPQQSLELISLLKSLHQFRNRLRLIPSWLVFRMQFKMIHSFLLIFS